MVTPRIRHALLAQPAEGSALLDDLKTVAVLVAEGEHGRHALPAQYAAGD
jgi:hypothetical protein